LSRLYAVIYLHRLDIIGYIIKSIDTTPSQKGHLYFTTFCKFIPVENQSNYLDAEARAFTSH